MTELIVACLLVLGSIFMLSASIGIFRLPDLFTRMQATTKASSFSLGLFLTATAFYFDALEVKIISILIILFIFSTAPVGAHMIARVAHFLKIPLWEGTVIDELTESRAKTVSASGETRKKPKKSGNEKISEIFRKLRGKKF